MPSPVIRNRPPAANWGLLSTAKVPVGIRARMGDTRHGRHVDLVHVAAAENDAGDVLHGHTDAPLDRTVGRVAHQIPAGDLRVPHVAFGIDGRAVRDAGVVMGRGKDPLVRDVDPVAIS